MRIAAAAVLLTALLAACATIGEVDLSDEACAAAFRGQIASILAGQGEEPEEAEAIAQRAVVGLGFGVGLRPFVVGSRTTDYTFFVEKKETGCLLRLLARERGLVRYSNDVTDIDSRPLSGCRCTSWSRGGIPSSSRRQAPAARIDSRTAGLNIRIEGKYPLELPLGAPKGSG